jgi:hypothetical protein
VAAVLPDAPAAWRNCTSRDVDFDPDDLDLPLDHVLSVVSASAERGHWGFFILDEVWVTLDLDVDEDIDPIITTLRGHPAVRDAEHLDREVYVFDPLSSISAAQGAALVIQALLAGHRHALRDAGLSP